MGGYGRNVNQMAGRAGSMAGSGAGGGPGKGGGGAFPIFPLSHTLSPTHSSPGFTGWERTKPLQQEVFSSFPPEK